MLPRAARQLKKECDWWRFQPRWRAYRFAGGRKAAITRPRFVHPTFGDRDIVAFEEDQRSADAGAFVAVEERLGLGQVKGVCRGDVEEISLAVKPHVARMHDGALQSGRVTHAILAAVLIQGEAMESPDLLDGEEDRIAHRLSFCIRSACRSNTRLVDSSNVCDFIVRTA